MKQQKVNRVTLLSILSLGLAACASVAGSPLPSGTPVSSISTPPAEIPVTGSTGNQTASSSSLTATPSSSAGMVIVTKDTPVLGYFLMDNKGMTLYTFIKDPSGKSTCNGTCATIWPPLSAQVLPTGGTGVWRQFALIEREDGTMQVTYNGMPLYYFSGDMTPGDINGEGEGGLWFAAVP